MLIKAYDVRGGADVYCQMVHPGGVQLTGKFHVEGTGALGGCSAVVAKLCGLSPKDALAAVLSSV